MRRGIPKVLVVITDGRSQDDVNKVSREMQLDGKLCGFRNNSHVLFFSLIASKCGHEVRIAFAPVLKKTAIAEKH